MEQTKLEAEIAELMAKAVARKQAKEASEMADVSMDSMAAEAIAV